jgi:hypothetical protein
MPKHKPIKFETTLEPSLIRRVKEIKKNEKMKNGVNSIFL